MLSGERGSGLVCSFKPKNVTLPPCYLFIQKFQGLHLVLLRFRPLAEKKCSAYINLVSTCSPWDRAIRAEGQEVGEMLLRGQSGSTSCRVRLERKAPTSTATWDHSQLLHKAKLAQNRDRLPWSGAWAASFCWGLGLTVLSPQVPLPLAFNNPPQSPTVLLIQQPLCVLWDFFQAFCSISKFLGPSSTLLLKAAAKCRCQLLQGAFPDSPSWQSSLPCLPLSVTRSGKN